MRLGSLGGAVRHIRRLDDALVTDRQLLEAFAAGDRGAAFGRLVERHGPMVCGVCNRVLRNAADADDAFQATFLVLAKQARSRGWHDSVANYLYGVAYRTALRARGRAARRKHHEERVPPRPAASPDDRISLDELRAALDEELTRLPEKFRLPVLLCCVHDRTIEEAASTLGLPATTVKGRLQQGRELLRDRLASRGFALGVGVLAALSHAGTATAVPASLIARTLTLATACPASETVVTLARQEFVMLFWKKARITAAAVLGLGFAIGVGVASMTSSAAPVPKSPPATQVEPPAVSEPAEVNGLSVSVRPTKVAFGPDEQPQFVVSFANRSGKVFRIRELDLATDVWQITPADGSGPWQSGPFAYAARAPGPVYRLDPDGGGCRVAIEYPKAVRGPFVWKGEQAKPVPSRPFLTPGKYTAVMKLSLSAEKDNNPIPEWGGNLTTNPVAFVIAEKPQADPPAPVVITEDMNGKTVRARIGQVIEVRLVSPKKLEGWEGGSVSPEAAVRFLSRGPSFQPAAATMDESVGHYRFTYVASAAGSVDLEMTLMTPSGPTVERRRKTLPIRTFRVTIEVTK
jgi:RNA polymerase sigma factor (sigma-70 family)